MTINITTAPNPSCCTNVEAMCNECQGKAIRKARKVLRRTRSHNLDYGDELSANHEEPLYLPVMDFAERKAGKRKGQHAMAAYESDDDDVLPIPAWED